MKQPRNLQTFPIFVLVFVGFCGIHSIQAANAPDTTKTPNILMIMVDDLGWMDLHCQGNRRLTTPHIDRLASEGMRFTDAYSAAPVCSPTRAAVLTGLSPATLKITNHIPDQDRFVPQGSKLLPAKMKDRLDPSHTTIAELLQAKGYATGFFGKWHLAGPRLANGKGKGDVRCYPEQHGFDVNLGGCAVGGPFSFFDPFNLHNLPDKKEGQYMPDRYADELIQFMEKNREKPFMACLWNYTVHWPMEAPEADLRKYRDRKDLGKLDFRYAAMIEAMDRSMGRIFAALNRLKLSDHTIVIFTSDNGAYGGVADMKPLREAKGYLYEGGIRVPLIVRWPGVVPPKSVCREPVISMDFFPTLAAACGADRRGEVEGEDLKPLLTQTGSLKRDAIYFHYPNFAFHTKNRLGGAIRMGKFKLIERFADQSVELYDLEKDLGETVNLASQTPELTKRMLLKLQAWQKKTGAEMPTLRRAQRKKGD